MTARVFFITSSPRFDLSSAEDFGDPVFITREREISPFNVDAVMEAIDRKLTDHEFSSDDYVALTGPSALVALFLGYLGGLRRPIKLLIFNAAQGSYQSRVMDASQTPHAPSRGEG